MKYKKKFNGLITLILFFIILISIFTLPIIIQEGHYATATLWVFFLLFVCFLAGYRVAVQDKDDSIETLISCIKSRVSHNVRFSESTTHLPEEDIIELNVKLAKTVDSQVKNYFRID
jgi:hypothetical protein